MKETEDEQIEKLQERLEKTKARLQQLQAKKKEKERKERTRRLIQIGAIFERYFEISSIEEAETIAKTFAGYVKAHKPASPTQSEKIQEHEEARS